MLNRIADKWMYLLFGVLWIVVIAVAEQVYLKSSARKKAIEKDTLADHH